MIQVMSVQSLLFGDGKNCAQVNRRLKELIYIERTTDFL